jgi:hypothetical protein
MLKDGTHYKIALLQSQMLEGRLLLSSGLLERKEDWRDAAVVRDATGRFASTGKAISQAADNVKSALDPERLKQIQDSIRNSLSNGTSEVRNILDNAFGNGAAVWRKEVAESFGDLADGLKEAIAKDPFPELTKRANDAIAQLSQYKNKAVDAATKNAVAKEAANLFEAAKTQYDKTIYDLDNLEGKPELVRLLGKTVAELIPEAIYIGSFYVGGMLANWAIFALLPPLAIAARIPPLVEIAQQITFLVAANEAVKLDKKARGVDDEALKNEPWWKRFGEGTRSAMVYILASAGIGLGIGLVDGTLTGLIKKSATDAIAHAKANKEVPEQVRATLEQIRKKLPQKRKIVEEKIAALADYYKDSEPMPREVAAHVYKRAIDFEEKLLKRFKDVPDFPELVEAANINITKAIHEAEIHIRAPDLAVPQILGSRFKSTFETNSRELKAYVQKRSRVEKNFFGIDKDWAAEKRPIYGYFARLGNAAKKEGANTDGYGIIALRLKPGVKRRATFLGHDSFWANDMGSIASAHDVPTIGTFLSGKESRAETVRIISEIAKAKDVEDIRKIAGTVKIPGTEILAKASYLEAVVHGGVDASDIAEVIFPYIPGDAKSLEVIEQWVEHRLSGKDTGDEIYNAIIDTIIAARGKGIVVTFGG